jgi:hypothetical protein
VYHHVLAYCCEHAAIDHDINAAMMTYNPLDILQSAHASEYYYKYRVKFDYFALMRTTLICFEKVCIFSVVQTAQVSA